MVGLMYSETLEESWRLYFSFLDFSYSRSPSIASSLMQQIVYFMREQHLMAYSKTKMETRGDKDSKRSIKKELLPKKSYRTLKPTTELS